MFSENCNDIRSIQTLLHDAQELCSISLEKGLESLEPAKTNRKHGVSTSSCGI